MSTRLPPFSGDEARCIKCGNVGAHTSWEEAHTFGGSVLTPERLRRRCERCDYEWDEAVIEAEAAPNG